MQAVSTMYFWRPEQQLSFSKAMANLTTTLNAELFAIRLSIVKATIVDIKYIILITNFLGSIEKNDLSTEQTAKEWACPECTERFIVFSCSINYKIKFWDYSSNTKWLLHQLVYNNVTNTKVAARLYLATSINTLCSKSVLLCLDT